MKQNTIILVVILLLVVGGGSFATGYKVAEGKNVIGNFARNGTGQMIGRGDRNVQNQQGNMMRGNRQIAGEIIALDDKTMTVKMVDGSSKIVLLSSTMTISKSVDAPKTELKVGSKVAVFGAQNPDGSQTATTIEIDPKFLGQTQNLVPSVTK
jgi:hypothetical protein